MQESKKFRFAFVSNSSEIARAVRVYADPQQEEVIIKLATMEEALPVARTILAEGVDVVLGGGATGKLLRRRLDQPVVTIARTHLDVLRALIKAQKKGCSVGLTSFEQPTDGVDIFARLLDMRVQQIIFNSSTELVAGIRKAVDEGVECIVGGICNEIASSLGVEGIIVTPSNEVIQRAFEEARSIAAAQRKEREKAEQLQIILQTVVEGVIGIDAEGKVNILNQTAAEFLKLDPHATVGKPLPEIVKGTGIIKVLETGMAEIDQIRRIVDTDIVINSIPVKADNKVRSVVSTFRQAAKIQNIDRKLKEKLYSKGLVAKYTLDHFKGQSREIVQLRDKAARYARADTTILIQGETGTGKEILAQGIHNASDRKYKPFVAINCSALPESLLESELFGYEEGAFTGAKRGGKIGLFELANEGTIFLDEIADIPQILQARLLRVLEEKEVMRVGGDRIIRVDVRIISSTYKDLACEVKNHRFRADLYFRLAVLRIHIPPLRNRSEDIPLLARELFSRYCKGNEKIPAGIIRQLMEYEWPGNVRELDALLKSYAVLLDGKISDEKLFQELFAEVQANELICPNPVQQPLHGFQFGQHKSSLKEMVEQFEAEQINEVLRDCRFNRQEAAKILGISVNTLWRKLKHQQRESAVQKND